METDKVIFIESYLLVEIIDLLVKHNINLKQAETVSYILSQEVHNQRIQKEYDLDNDYKREHKLRDAGEDKLDPIYHYPPYM